MTSRMTAACRFDSESATHATAKHRILFLLAGTFTLAGTALAAGVNRWFALLPAAVGANQLLYVTTGWCPASALLDRLNPAEVEPNRATT